MGFTCEEYARLSDGKHCSIYGHEDYGFGKANDACCSCGGGMKDEDEEVPHKDYHENWHHEHREHHEDWHKEHHHDWHDHHEHGHEDWFMDKFEEECADAKNEVQCKACHFFQEEHVDECMDCQEQSRLQVCPTEQHCWPAMRETFSACMQDTYNIEMHHHDHHGWHHDHEHEHHHDGHHDDHHEWHHEFMDMFTEECTGAENEMRCKACHYWVPNNVDGCTHCGKTCKEKICPTEEHCWHQMEGCFYECMAQEDVQAMAEPEELDDEDFDEDFENVFDELEGCCRDETGGMGQYDVVWGVQTLEECKAACDDCFGVEWIPAHKYCEVHKVPLRETPGECVHDLKGTCHRVVMEDDDDDDIVKFTVKIPIIGVSVSIKGCNNC
jgi:hypothetical protein